MNIVDAGAGVQDEAPISGKDSDSTKTEIDGSGERNRDAIQQAGVPIVFDQGIRYAAPPSSRASIRSPANKPCPSAGR